MTTETLLMTTMLQLILIPLGWAAGTWIAYWMEDRRRKKEEKLYQERRRQALEQREQEHKRNLQSYKGFVARSFLK